MENENTVPHPTNCNCLNLRRASLMITKIYDNWISPSGLTIGQFAILKHIMLLQPVSVSELSIEIRLDRTTLVRSIKPLEEEGFIIDDSVKGTRNRQLRLSELGADRYRAAEVYWEKAQDFIEQKLGTEDLNTLMKLLQRIEKIEM